MKLLLTVWLFRNVLSCGFYGYQGHDFSAGFPSVEETSISLFYHFFLKTESCLVSLSHSATSLAAFVVGSRRCVHTLVCSCRWHHCGLISWGLKSTFFPLRVQVLSPVLLRLWSRSDVGCARVCVLGGAALLRVTTGQWGWGWGLEEAGGAGTPGVLLLPGWVLEGMPGSAQQPVALLCSEGLCSSIELWVVCRACVVLQITSLYSNRRIIMQPTRGIQWNGLSLQK